MKKIGGFVMKKIITPLLITAMVASLVLFTGFGATSDTDVKTPPIVVS